MREEPVALASSAHVETVDPVDARSPQGTLGRRPEVEPPVAGDVVAERLAERRRDLLPDLVAARADARTDRRDEPARAERAHSCGDDAGEQAAPAGVKDLHRGADSVCPR